MSSVATLLMLTVLAAEGPRQFTMMDFWKRRCEEGAESYCRRLESMQAELEHADRLEKYGQEFAGAVVRDELESNNRPILNEAYRRIMADYLEREPAVEAADETTLKTCADHYHDYWLGRKLWWPTDAQGRPDWAVIYTYVVDHYFGRCLRPHI